MIKKERVIVNDETEKYYCTINLNCELSSDEISKIIEEIFIDLLNCEGDFSTEFERKIKSISKFKNVEFDYNLVTDK